MTPPFAFDWQNSSSTALTVRFRGKEISILSFVTYSQSSTSCFRSTGGIGKRSLLLVFGATDSPRAAGAAGRFARFDEAAAAALVPSGARFLLLPSGMLQQK